MEELKRELIALLRKHGAIIDTWWAGDVEGYDIRLPTSGREGFSREGWLELSDIADEVNAPKETE